MGLLSWLKRRGGDRGQYVSDAVPPGVDKILDIGCAYGWGLGALTGKAKELWGVDMDEDALRQARAAYPHVHFVHQTAAELPFPGDTFDVVILSEVIEHVGDENKQLVIDEAHRVLKDGGLFLFTAPYAGLLAWADPMDFKRRFPGVYRAYMRVARYTPATPVEVGHKHLSLREIERLFAGRFHIEDIRFCGLLMPFLSWLGIVGGRLRLLPRRIERALAVLIGWESGLPYGPVLSYNVRLRARKKPAGNTARPLEALDGDRDALRA